MSENPGTIVPGQSPNRAGLRLHDVDISPAAHVDKTSSLLTIQRSRVSELGKLTAMLLKFSMRIRVFASHHTSSQISSRTLHLAGLILLEPVRPIRRSASVFH